MNIGIIFAGGTGQRMSSTGTPKQLLEVNGKPILVYTLEHFQNNDNIDGIVLVVLESIIGEVSKLVQKYSLDKVKSIIPGGKTGQESIYLGIQESSRLYDQDSIVLLHDGVRPIIDSDLIVKNIENVKKNGSAISSVPQKETTIMLDEQKQYITEVTNREFTYIARAPQSFFLKELLECHNKALKEGKNNFIDSASLMMNYGKKLSIVECNTDNLKITTPDDFYIVRAILEARENMQIFGG